MASRDFLASGTEDGVVSIWDLRTHALLQRTSGVGSPVRSLAFSSDETRLLSADETRTLVWDTSLETRSPAVIEELVRCRVPYELVDAGLVRRTPSRDCQALMARRPR